MIIMKKIIPILIMMTIITCAASGMVSAEKTFGLPNDYLQYGAGARSLAMGSAFTGLADDGTAGYWNPAALAFLDEYQLITMYAPYRMDTQYNFVSAAIPFGPWGAVSVSDVMLMSGGFQERNDLNQVLGSNQSVMKNAASMSYAQSFLKHFSAGVRIKFLQERVFSTSGDAFGVDGSLYTKPFYGVSAGLTVNNINRPKITLIEAPDVYGRQTRLGAAYHGLKDALIITMDMNKAEEQSAFYTMGCEVNPVKLLSVRAGLNQQGAVTAGIGINIWPFKVDYAFSGHEDLGVFNKISMTLRWGNVYAVDVKPAGMTKETGSILMKGLYNEVKFNASVPNIAIKWWTLEIDDREGQVVKKMGGEKRPPEKIVWDMTDNAGQPVKRGRYGYRFKIEYYNEKTWEDTGRFELDFNDASQNSVDIKVKGE